MKKQRWLSLLVFGLLGSCCIWSWVFLGFSFAWRVSQRTPTPSLTPTPVSYQEKVEVVFEKHGLSYISDTALCGQKACREYMSEDRSLVAILFYEDKEAVGIVIMRKDKFDQALSMLDDIYDEDVATWFKANRPDEVDKPQKVQMENRQLFIELGITTTNETFIVMVVHS